jgi:predicted nucleotidyltransferase
VFTIDGGQPVTHEPGKRKPKDRDFLRTEEGLFFCVTGYLHPPDRYTAYLKYSPASSGKWHDGETAYHRELPYYHVRNVGKTIRYLDLHYPWYVYDCPVRNIRFSMVSHEHVARYYDPQVRLREILADPRDPLEEEVRGLAVEVAARAGISQYDLGITGSILIGLHNPAFSDIDLLVYGLEKGHLLQQALREGRSSQIRRVGDEQVAEWCRRIAKRFPLTLEEAQYFADRRWHYGFYGQRYFSVHPTRTDVEITERYGDRIYRDRGVARIRATVAEAGEALFQPSIYRLEGVRVLEGDPGAAEVREVVSYEGLYRDVVAEGEDVEARGKLESVNDRSYRLVIGTAALGGAGYIKPRHLGKASRQ